MINSLLDSNIIFLLYEQNEEYNDEQLNNITKQAKSALNNYKGIDIFGDRKLAGVNYVIKGKSWQPQFRLNGINPTTLSKAKT